ncbi:hypothetical protein T09_3802, partial [Trichinella sp. T9]
MPSSVKIRRVQNCAQCRGTYVNQHLHRLRLALKADMSKIYLSIREIPLPHQRDVFDFHVHHAFLRASQETMKGNTSLLKQ